MIKTVFIDVDNTLLDFHACAMASMAEACAAHGVAFTREMFDTFTRVNNGLWLALERKEITREELHRVRFARIFEALGLDLDGPAFEALFRQKLDRAAEPVPGAMELLRYLSGKYTVCAASNAAQSQQFMRLEKAGMLPCLTELFTSGRMGADKPGAAFFEACFALLPGAKPEETVMIGDSLSADVRGARDFGLVTCWYNPKGEPAPEDLQPDFTVRRLEEIKAFL